MAARVARGGGVRRRPRFPARGVSAQANRSDGAEHDGRRRPPRSRGSRVASGAGGAGGGGGRAGARRTAVPSARAVVGLPRLGARAPQRDAAPRAPPIVWFQEFGMGIGNVLDGFSLAAVRALATGRELVL